MGYWAKDGSYVYDENDIKHAESMNETQGQYYERVQAGITHAEAYAEEQQRKAQVERDFAAQSIQEDRLYEKEAALKIKESINSINEANRRWENQKRYGVDFDLRSPATLEERRDRANLWRCNNVFGLFVDKISKKEQKFHALWQQYAVAKSEEERLQIVEQMEKMYPTTEALIRAEEKKAGYRK